MAEVDYKLLACNVQTNEVIEELPWKMFTYRDGINAYGGIEATVPLRHSKVTKSTIYPWTTALYVERNDQIRYGGIVTSCVPNTSDGTLAINCSGLLVYLAARTQNITKTFLYGDDQTSVVANWLITKMLEDYDIGWEVDTPASGITREWETFYSYEHREYSTLFERISTGEFGFDYAVQSAWVNGEIVDTFRTFYPRRGVRKDLLWTKYAEGNSGSNIDIVSAPHDGMTQANVVHLLGNGDGYGMLTATATNPNLIGPDKYPMIEVTVTDKSRDIQSEVDGRALEVLLLAQEPVITASLKLREDEDDTSLGSFDVGDEVKLVADDGWLQLDGYWRVTDYNVAVADGNREDVSVDVTKRTV